MTRCRIWQWVMLALSDNTLPCCGLQQMQKSRLQGGNSQIMARKHTPGQVIAKVRQGRKMLNDGRPMIEVIKELQITEATWYPWLQQHGSEKNATQTKAVKDLEKENARLKRMVAEKELAIDILNEVARGKY